MNNRQTRILLVDDHAVVRTGYRARPIAGTLPMWS
jgi:hypothetical protein